MVFKSGTRLWSNRYHFSGGNPPDIGHWDTLFDAVTAAEKTLFQSDVIIVEALGYLAGSEVPVASKTYSIPGTFVAGANDAGTPGEVAALVRFNTNARSIKNHPVYCFNYYHGAVSDKTVNTDKLGADQKALIDAYAVKWLAGFSDGGSVTAKRASPKGTACVGHITEEWLTHRDFPPTSSV